MNESETFTITGHLNGRLMAEYPLDKYHAIAVDYLGQTDDGRRLYHYILFIGQAIVFEGSDFSSGIDDDVDYGAAARSILKFLTLRPGEITPNYFQNYTKAQIAWRDEYAESLSIYALDNVEFIGVYL